MSKLDLSRTRVFSTALWYYSLHIYACKTWVVTVEVFERICYRKALRIGWKQRIRNEELYNRIHLKETVLQNVIRRKSPLFRHICRIDKNRKIRDIMFGIVDGKNKKGRPDIEWLDESDNGVRKLL